VARELLICRIDLLICQRRRVAAKMLIVDWPNHQQQQIFKHLESFSSTFNINNWRGANQQFRRPLHVGRDPCGMVAASRLEVWRSCGYH
jgi:hypothetical protein